MKIMTFNTQHCLNYVEKKIDYSIFAEAITKCDADIVGLNEMRGFGIFKGYDNQTKILSEMTGLEHYFFASAIGIKYIMPYGNGIISKIPIISSQKIMIPDPSPKKYKGFYQTRCILKVKLENGLTILVSHFGLNPDEQINAVKTAVDNIEDKKCVLMGDFNLKPDSEIIRPIYEKMTDTSVLFEKEKYSYPSDNPNVKIDYIFTSHDIIIKSSDIPAIVASDHRPHIAEIIV